MGNQGVEWKPEYCFWYVSQQIKYCHALFFFIYKYHRTFKFLYLLFECGFENITVDRTRHSLKEQKKIRLLVVMYTLMGFSDWQLDLESVFAVTVLLISLVEDCGKWQQ